MTRLILLAALLLAGCASDQGFESGFIEKPAPMVALRHEWARCNGWTGNSYQLIPPAEYDHEPADPVQFVLVDQSFLDAMWSASVQVKADLNPNARLWARSVPRNREGGHCIIYFSNLLLTPEIAVYAQGHRP